MVPVRPLPPLQWTAITLVGSCAIHCFVLPANFSISLQRWDNSNVIGTWGIQLFLYFPTVHFRTTVDYRTIWFDPKFKICMLNGLYFKTTWNTWHFLSPTKGATQFNPIIEWFFGGIHDTCKGYFSKLKTSTSGHPRVKMVNYHGYYS